MSAALERRWFLCCAWTIASRAAPDTDTPARIFVYAQRQTPLRSALEVQCNGTKIARARKGSFFSLRLREGRYTLATENGVPVTVEVRAGEERFVRVDWNHHVNRSPIPVMSVVPADRARQEMRFLRYAAGKDIDSEAVEKSDPRPPKEPALQRR